MDTLFEKTTLLELARSHQPVKRKKQA